MSYFSCQEPVCHHELSSKKVVAEVIPRLVDLGGFQVGRVIPSQEKKTVGPFIFLDQVGPGEFIAGQGLDVRPHPHICLSTLTYLFSGSIIHKDSLGSDQIILPGEVNLMTAGKGIAHSERSPQASRQRAHALFGIQAWLALPIANEEMDPAFTHYDKDSIPLLQQNAAFSLRVVAGEYQGSVSPVNTQIDAIFYELSLEENARFVIPAHCEERAILLLQGEIEIDQQQYSASQLLILKPGDEIVLFGKTRAFMIILGGSSLESPRYLWWNFVASSKDRIEQAKEDWLNGKFALIPGDSQEFIPLPQNK